MNRPLDRPDPVAVAKRDREVEAMIAAGKAVLTPEALLAARKAAVRKRHEVLLRSQKVT